jgi:hypothetical protein
VQDEDQAPAGAQLAPNRAPDNAEIIEAVHARHAAMVPVSASLRL